MESKDITLGVAIGILSGLVTVLIMSANTTFNKFTILLVLFPTIVILLLVMNHLVEKSSKNNKGKIIITSEILLALGASALTYFLIRKRKK